MNTNGILYSLCKFKIGYSGDSLTITLDKAVQFRHFGSQDTVLNGAWNVNGLHMGCEGMMFTLFEVILVELLLTV